MKIVKEHLFDTDEDKNGKPDHKLRVYSDITQLIASPENMTPLVRVNKTNLVKAFEIYLKLERYNPFGSIKDRIAYEMLKALDTNGKTIVEPTSGNTGIALAGMANALGIPVEVVVPEHVPEEKKVLLKLLGARVTEADDALCPLYPNEGARGLVNAMLKSPATKGKYVSPNQYENELNVLAHYRTTGPEIWRQTEGRITHFFAGFGTCGTITGVGKYLKEQNSAIRIIGIEPEKVEHKLSGLRRITGMEAEFTPKILDMSVIDDVISVSDRDAYGTAIELARKDGILVGPTTGAVLYAALRFGKSAHGLAVGISPDDAFKYTSFYREFLNGAIEKEKEFDFCSLACPLSRLKAAQVLDTLRVGETARIALGDKDSLESVAEELKLRGIKSTFKKEDETRFVLVVTR